MKSKPLPQVTVKIPGPLRTRTLACTQVQVRAGSVRQALNALAKTDAEFAQLVFLPDGSLRRTVIVSVGQQDVRLRQGLDTPLREDDEVVLVAAISGG